MWIRALALAVLATLLAGPAFLLSPVLGDALIALAAGASLWSVYEGVKPRLRSRDPYSLGELKRVHEDEERRALEPEGEVVSPAQVVCSRCYTDYDARLRACPKCGAGG